MTKEELQNMNVKQVAERFLSNHCGKCDDCELNNKDLQIGGTIINICHLLYSVLKEDRKREDMKK